jgi:hypothetical protein
MRSLGPPPPLAISLVASGRPGGRARLALRAAPFVARSSHRAKRSLSLACPRSSLALFAAARGLGCRGSLVVAPPRSSQLGCLREAFSPRSAGLGRSVHPAGTVPAKCAGTVPAETNPPRSRKSSGRQMKRSAPGFRPGADRARERVARVRSGLGRGARAGYQTRHKPLRFPQVRFTIARSGRAIPHAPDMKNASAATPRARRSPLSRMTPAARAAKKTRSHAAYLARKNDPEFIAANRARALAHHHAHKHQRNEKRAARHHRTRAKLFPADIRWKRAGFSIVSADGIAYDRTRWRGPGMRREQQIEELANSFLRDRAVLAGQPKK